MIARKLQSHVLGTWEGGGGNEPNDRKIVSINVIKIFHEHEVNDAEKVGIKCFCAQEAEISLCRLLFPITHIKIFHQHYTHDH